MVPVETWIAGLTVTTFCNPVWTAVEGGCGCVVAGESNDPTAKPGGCCKPAHLLRTAAKISDRSCVICTSEKAVAGAGVWSRLTDSGAGVAWLGPATSKGATRAGKRGSIQRAAPLSQSSRDFEPELTALNSGMKGPKVG